MYNKAGYGYQFVRQCEQSTKLRDDGCKVLLSFFPFHMTFSLFCVNCLFSFPLDALLFFSQHTAGQQLFVSNNKYYYQQCFLGDKLRLIVGSKFQCLLKLPWQCFLKGNIASLSVICMLKVNGFLMKFGNNEILFKFSKFNDPLGHGCENTIQK